MDAGEAEMITKLTADTVAFSGDGTQENPYTYICKSGVEEVTVTKGFLNLMMGYSPGGKEKYEEVTPYHFQIIFYSEGDLKVLHVNSAERFKEIEFPLLLPQFRVMGRFPGIYGKIRQVGDYPLTVGNISSMRH